MKIDSLKQCIDKLAKSVDDEGNILNQTAYEKAREGIENELASFWEDDINELKKEVDDIKELLKSHAHHRGKVLITL